jgi:hypothetical protein
MDFSVFNERLFSVYMILVCTFFLLLGWGRGIYSLLLDAGVPRRNFMLDT